MFLFYYKQLFMVLKKVYNEKTKTQKAWFDSTMIFYTKMVEYDDENKGDLFVTFKNGTTYKYTGVSFEDYVLFIGGGTDASQGKTLNKVIKSKYEYEKIGDADLDKLREEMNKCEEETNDIQNTYFISGHRDITETEFEINYEPAINWALHENSDAKFIVGDYYGADIMAQNYLIDVIGIDPSRVTVYHMFDAPRNINPSITKTKGGFQSDEERDAAMTNASVKDIAFVRDITKISGTAQNILRRKKLQTL